MSHSVPSRKRHITGNDLSCWCGPHRDTNNLSVIVHASARVEPVPQRPDPVSPSRYPPTGWMVGVFVFLFVLIVGLFLRVVVLG